MTFRITGEKLPDKYPGVILSFHCHPCISSSESTTPLLHNQKEKQGSYMDPYWVGGGIKIHSATLPLLDQPVKFHRIIIQSEDSMASTPLGMRGTLS